MAIPQSILDYAQVLKNAPFETFSRFLDDSPANVWPEKLEAHLARGGGLNCTERAWAMSAYLGARGIRNEVVGGGFEMWFEGQRRSPLVSESYDEDLAARFYAPEWPTSVYERPPHLLHRAVVAELPDGPHLIDIMGGLARTRIFGPEETTRLLDARPKPHLMHSPLRLRLYYHRITPRLRDLMAGKERGSSAYEVGDLLTTVMLGGTHSTITMRWFWKDSALASTLATEQRAQQQVSGGESTLTFCETVDQALEVAPDLDRSLARSFAKALPGIREHIRKVFDAPRHVRLVVVRSKRPIVEYSDNTLLVA
jgi:hypothetical protein